MKTKLFFAALFAALLLTSMQVEAQEWAPIGAKWYYEYIDSDHTGFRAIEAIDTEEIDGILCQKISVTDSLYWDLSHEFIIFEREPVYTYTDNNIVYFYNGEEFSTLYDFNAQVGDSWIVSMYFGDELFSANISVLTRETIQINGIELIQLTITNDNQNITLGTTISQTIGSNLYLFPQFEGEAVAGPLRCYSSFDFGFYHVEGQDACDYTTSVNEPESHDAVTIINTNGLLSLSTENTAYTQVYAYAITGQLLSSSSIEAGQVQLNLSAFKKQLVLLKLVSINNSLTIKQIL